ncbi:MAG: hypothetical protein D4R79_16630 [Comamonadaceae bacterium]|nr:MAG: hypothetical protein D4R79_16630 [Comamonadaceae bacterium]
MSAFFDQLAIQRWDDHRYYHQSRINQTLHLVSAVSFLVAYVFLFIQPAVAALIGWLVGMVTRQSGHFFFEPLGYDQVNQVSNDYKEEIKVGYNLRRKVVLLTIWVASPLMLVLNPSLFGLFEIDTSIAGFIQHTGLIWLALGIGGLIFRTVHLFFIKDVMSGLVWLTKILTDPFNDIVLYYKSPLALLRGEMLDSQHKPSKV